MRLQFFHGLSKTIDASVIRLQVQIPPPAHWTLRPVQSTYCKFPNYRRRTHLHSERDKTHRAVANIQTQARQVRRPTGPDVPCRSLEALPDNSSESLSAP